MYFRFEDHTFKDKTSIVSRAKQTIRVGIERFLFLWRLSGYWGGIWAFQTSVITLMGSVELTPHVRDYNSTPAFACRTKQSIQQ